MISIQCCYSWPYDKINSRLAQKMYDVPDDLILKQVTIIHRHGARSPIFNSNPSHRWNYCNLIPSFMAQVHKMADHLYPLDIHFTGSAGLSHLQSQLRKVNTEECFLGQLTDLGKHNQTSLGTLLRERYIANFKLLPSTWNADESNLYLRSTNYVRTIESLQYLLHGLYPRTELSKVKPKVYIQSKELENMFPNDTSCLSLSRDILGLRTVFQEKHRSRLIELLTPLSFWHSMHERTPSDQAYRIYDRLTCMVGNNIPFPDGINEEDRTKLEVVMIELWARLYDRDPSFTKRAVGRFVGDLIVPIKSAFNKVSGYPKMAIFSGHDSTLIPVMIALNLFEGSYPQFSDNLTLEYFESKQDAGYVRLLYNQKPLLAPFCSANGTHHELSKSFCKVESFLNQAASMTLSEEEFDEQCEIKKSI